MTAPTTRVSLLVSGDDPVCLATIASALPTSAFAVTASSTEDVLRTLFDVRPQVALVDLNERAAGWQTLDRLQECCAVPTIALGPGGDEIAVVRALNAGADDFVAKPVGAAELVARIEARLRTAGRGFATPDVHDDGYLRIDHERRAVTVVGTPVRLTPMEFRLLATLVRHQGKVLSRDQLLELVWGHTTTVGSGDEVRVYVRYVRQKLLAAWPDDPIETVRGFGYAYAPPAVPAVAV